MARLRAEDAEKRAASGYGPDSRSFCPGFAGDRRLRAREEAHDLERRGTRHRPAKPSVRRALYTLTCLGLAASDGRTFRLTPRIMSWPRPIGSNMVSTIVQPACERIGDRTEQSCFAAVLDGYDIVMIAHSLHGRPDVLAPTIGLRRPAFNTAAGRAILSQLPDKTLDGWLEKLEPKVMTDFTVTDKKALRAETCTCAKQGYAITAQEMRRGYHAVAVPLKRYDGATIAAVCVAAWVEDRRGIVRRGIPGRIRKRQKRCSRSFCDHVVLSKRRTSSPFATA